MRDIGSSTRQILFRNQVLLLFFVIFPLFLLLFITSHLNQTALFDFDRQLIWQIHQFANPRYDQLAMNLSYLGGMPTAMIVVLLLVGHSAYIKSKNIFFIIISVVGSTSLSWLLKVIVDRPRPMLWPRLVPDYGASFPSGHSVYAAAFAGIFIILYWQTKWRFAVSCFAFAWLLLMGLSRVYLGVHYP
ncbi:MAG: phosphatase PAP2 family protein, partial [Candidatus Saccharibacteria bacterium]|nr:phosphatase PAP2 family protein [Moraxellaceae bacterium]